MKYPSYWKTAVITKAAPALMPLWLAVFSVAYCQAAEYNIPSSTLNSGGEYSTSTNYRLWQSTGEAAAGTVESTRYKINSGFLVPDEPNLGCTLSTNAVHLGTLTAVSVASEQATITVTTNISGGYSVTAHDDTPVGIANGLLDGAKKISDATTPNTYVAPPSAGSSHFGIIVTGTNADSGYESGTKMNSMDDTNITEIGAYNNIAEDDVFTVTFKASISASTPASSYYRTASAFICTANF